MSLKDQAKRFIASQPPLEKAMYQFYRWSNRHTAAEIQRRAGLSLFDYQALAAPLPYYPQERVVDNNLYGYAQAIKYYADRHEDLQGYLEHGLYLGGIVHPDQAHWHFERIFTMSEERVALLEKRLPGKKALALGPYIHYAQAHYGAEEAQSLKARLGRCLLVYPFHSMKQLSAQYSDPEFVAEIKRLAPDFDSVIICLYYLDALQSERVDYYRNEGYHIVCAGHKFDPYFVRRQKAHLELADFTLSNGVGTHTGYCTYLEKPHYIFQQKLAQKLLRPGEARRLAQLGSRQAAEAQRAEIAALYRKDDGFITEAQRELLGRQWGFEDLKSASELRALLKT